MASTIKVDNVQNQPGTNIIDKCGTTITLGQSGDTVALACGASQTGFGRTGTVDWDTTIHTGTVTAATGKGYFVNTTSGGITVNLPAAAVGSIVAVSDYASTAASNNITVSPNGSEKINGVNDDYTISTAGLAVTLVYADATRGWKSVTGSDADATGIAPAYVTASGGTPCSGAIVCTDYKVHTFTSPGTFVVSCAGNVAGSNSVNYLVIAGGGGGGSSPGYAGGGGAGGYREVFPQPGIAGLSVTATPYPITIGGGGAAASTVSTPGAAGSNSVFSTITSAGGGAGKACHPAPPVVDGGSGGGGGGPGAAPNPGGSGNTPPTPVAQGYDGGYGSGTPGTGGGGGGGASAVGKNFDDPTPGCQHKGGAGVTSTIDGTPTARGGGGSAAGDPTSPGTVQPGGAGGGGSGGKNPAASTAGTVNTGGGGGGGGNPGHSSMLGGSGIVIIRYKFQ